MKGFLGFILLGMTLAWGQPDDVRSAIKERIDRKKAVGIVVGTLDSKGQKIAAQGTLRAAGTVNWTLTRYSKSGRSAKSSHPCSWRI